MKKQSKNIWYKSIGSKAGRAVESYPLTSFAIALALVVGLIFAGSLWRAPKKEATTNTPSKKVQLYQIGTTPSVKYQGQVEKSGVTTIVALAGGIVQQTKVTAGTKVSRGQTLVTLSQNYQGGNAAALASQIAAKQYELTETTYNTQLESIRKQRDLADQNKANSEKLREMSADSASDTQSVLNLNNDIMDSLQKSIDALSVDPVGNATTILSTKQYLAQFKASSLQLQAGLRSADYQANKDNPPTQLANTQHDLLMKQYDIQEKSLSISRDISALSVKIAGINASMFYPGAPYAGVIQRVFVHPGQFVAPGTPLVTMSGVANQTADITVAVSEGIAQRISRLEKSHIRIGDKTIDVLPTFISSEAISGNQHIITYHISGIDVAGLTDKSFVDVELPLGNPDTIESVSPSIPIDSVYQTEKTATIFIVQDGKAISREVELGAVLGDYVQINKGLSTGDKLILSRSVQDGDPVEE